MQHGNQRTLAYTLATTISDHQLDHISGGYAEGSTRQTVAISGAEPQGADVQYDISKDFDF